MKLTKKNYFSLKADNHFMRSTQFKGFWDCEDRQMARLSGQWEYAKSKDMLIGSYVHAWNEGKLERFRDQNPEIYTIKGDLRAEFRQAE